MDRRTANTAPGLAATNPSTIPTTMFERYWNSMAAVTRALSEAQTSSAGSEKSSEVPLTHATSRGPLRHTCPPCVMAYAA